MAKKGGKGKGKGKAPPPLPPTLAVGLPLDPKSSFPIVQKALLPKAPKGKQRKAPAAPPPVAVHRPAPPKPPPRPRPPLLTTMPTMIISAAERAETAAVMGWLAMVGSVDATWSSPDGAIRGYTLLMCACECGHEDMVDALLRKGASPDLQDWKGITALMIAAGKGRGETVVRLLRGGASWELRAPKLGTAAEIAMGKGYPMIPELIKAHEATAAGAPLQKLPSEIISAAAAGESSPILNWLECGGRINAMGTSQATMLMIASEHGHERLVDALLNRGAELDMRRFDGMSALTIAATSGHRDVVRRLIAQRSAVPGVPPRHRQAPGEPGAAPEEPSKVSAFDLPETHMEFRLSGRWQKPSSL